MLEVGKQLPRRRERIHRARGIEMHRPRNERREVGTRLQPRPGGSEAPPLRKRVRRWQSPQAEACLRQTGLYHKAENRRAKKNAGSTPARKSSIFGVCYVTGVSRVTQIELTVKSFTLMRIVCQVVVYVCRRKMRMSCLCKVEMSGSMGGRGAHGNGANHVESTGTGPVESAVRGKSEASDAGSCRPAAESNRPPRAANAVASSRAWGWCTGSWTARPALEPPAGGEVRAEDFGATAAALCRFRPHAGRRIPGSGGFRGEPGDAAEMDDPGGLVASAFPTCEGRACVARAPSQFRRVGDAGQLTLPVAGGSRSGLPAHRADR